MILLSHPTGNEFVRAALEAFDRAGMLAEFWTTLSWDSNSVTSRLLPQQVARTFERRAFSETIRSRTHMVPFREILRLLTGAFSVDAVLRDFDLKVANRLRKIDGIDSVYAYEDAALESFRAAR